MVNDVNYNFYIDVDPPIFLNKIAIDEWERPTLGTQLKFKFTGRKVWEVSRVVPPSNPSDQEVTYYVLEV